MAGRKWRCRMDFRYETVIPNDDLPFRMFIFEEGMEITGSASIGTSLWNCFLCWRNAGFLHQFQAVYIEAQ